MNLFLRNVTAVGLAGILSLVLALILNTYSPLISPHWHYGILFLALLSFILNLVYANRARSKDFAQLLLATIVIKLLLTLVVILVYSVIDKANFFNFSIQFICYYILFTIFEIRYLLHIIKINSPSNP